MLHANSISITALILLLASPFIGSFLAVLADRLPRGEDIVTAPSRCRECATRLAPRDLVPLLSWLLLRGRCRHCDARLPRWLPGTEVAAIALAGLVLVVTPAHMPPALVVTDAALLWLLLALAVSDLLWMRLPDLLTALLFGTALLRALLAPAGDPGLALLGAALGAGSFLALRLGYQVLRGREGLGMGDVKLMAGLGALAGPFDLPLLVLIAALLALAGAAGRGLWTGQRPGATLALPFGAALAAAGCGIWLLQALG